MKAVVAAQPGEGPSRGLLRDEIRTLGWTFVSISIVYCDIVTNPLLSSMIVIVCTNEQPPCCSPLPAPVLGLSCADIIPLKSELS